MDIFNSAQRTREDAVKKPITYHDSQITQRRLQQQHQRQLDQFQFYLRNLYAKFDFKINKCRHSCFANPKSYFEARNCEQQCGEGVRKFSQYVDSRVGEMQELLSSCVANAATLPNALDETYNCYQKYNRGFGKLKEFITEESMYYE